MERYGRISVNGIDAAELSRNFILKVFVRRSKEQSLNEDFNTRLMTISEVTSSDIHGRCSYDFKLLTGIVIVDIFDHIINIF